MPQFANQQQETIDLTTDEVIIVHENVVSLILTYPRVEQQMDRAGIELVGGMLEYEEHGQLCQTDSMKSYFMLHLMQIDPQPVHIVVAEEKHQDGAKHIHCFVQWIRRNSFPNTYFDFHGMHPNIQICNNPLAGKRYVMKEDLACLRWVKCFDLTNETEGFFSPTPKAPPYWE